MNRANYSCFIIQKVIVIYDLNDGLSVTNDVENVIKNIAEKYNGLDGYFVIYRDTDGRYDQILVKDNEYHAFKLLNCKHLHNAIYKAFHE